MLKHFQKSFLVIRLYKIACSALSTNYQKVTVNIVLILDNKFQEYPQLENKDLQGNLNISEPLLFQAGNSLKIPTGRHTQSEAYKVGHQPIVINYKPL